MQTRLINVKENFSEQDLLKHIEQGELVEKILNFGYFVTTTDSLHHLTSTLEFIISNELNNPRDAAISKELLPQVKEMAENHHLSNKELIGVNVNNIIGGDIFRHYMQRGKSAEKTLNQSFAEN